MNILIRVFLFISAILITSSCYSQEERIRIDIVTNKKCLYSEFVIPNKVNEAKNAQVSWSGGCKNGYISGVGTLTKKSISGDVSVFKGSYENGLENGFFEIRSENATRIDKFKGVYSNGYAVRGEEELIYLKSGNQLTYSGEYLNGLITGNGVLTRKGKLVSKGTFKNGKLNGNGEKLYADGSYERGVFSNDELSGPGEILYSDRNYERGQFLAGKLNGAGFQKFVNGIELSANFVNGVAQGRGTLRHPSGETKTGNLIDGGFDGVVDVINGNLYGQVIYKNGQYLKVVDGSGIFINQNNTSYDGSCPCPYSIARDGSTCGARSAYSRSGGASPQCY